MKTRIPKWFLVAELLNSREEHVIGDVVQMTSVLERGSSSTDVISRALSVNFDKNQGVLYILPIPLVEWCQELKTLTAFENEINI